MADLREDLQDLVQHPGFRWLQETELTRWRDSLAQYIGQAAGDTDDSLALQKIRQVVAAHRAVEAVFARPAQKLQELQHGPATTPETFSRRGAL